MSDAPVPPTTPAIGQSLRHQRLQRNFTLEQAAQDTRIHIKFLRALEEERWQDFPARVYLEGFLKRYAGYLGMEDQEIVRQLRLSMQEGEKPGFSSPEPRKTKEDGSMTPATGRSIWLLAGGGALVLALALAYIKMEERRIDMESAFIPDPLTAPEAPPAPSEPVSHEGQVMAEAPVWVRVWVDGKVKFEGVLPARQPKSWVVEKDLRVMAGNPSLVQVTVDGQAVTLKPGGPAGEVHWNEQEAAPAAPPAPEAAPAEPAPAPPVPVAKPKPKPRPKPIQTAPAPEPAPPPPSRNDE